MQNLHSGTGFGTVAEGSAATPALLLSAIAALSFLAIAAAVAMLPETALIDGRVAMWLHLRAIPRLTDVMVAVSFLGAPTTLTVVAVAASLVLLYRRNYVAAATLSIVVLGGNFLNFLLKHLIERGRPVFEDPLFSLPTYSFPSGHAMASTVFYGLLAIGASLSATRRYAARAAIVAAMAMVALVCFSRVYLGLHYVSDVAGGIAEGVAWLALSIVALHQLRRRNAGR
jgi:membrane-associated phospholipid phosphatase